MHTRTFASIVVAMAVVALFGVGAPGPASADARTAAPGISDDEIQIVALVSDLDGLRSKGFNLSPKLTTGNLVKRWQAYADDYGPIHGRRVVVTPAVWDPIDPTTYDDACTQATQDNQPFVVVNGSGFNPSAAACVTVDHDTPLMLGESADDALYKASHGNLLSLGLSAEANARSTAALVAKAKLVPKTAKVAILTGNEPVTASAGKSLEAALTDHGFDVVETVTVNTLPGDTAAMNRESAAAVATFQAAGADTVFNLLPFVAATGYYQEAKRSGAPFANVIMDSANSTCTQFAASRTPAEIAGAPCITTWDTRALPTKDGVKADSAFEARCRSVFDKAFATTSQPGVPAGDITAGGVTYTEDLPPNECTMMSLLLPAIKAAGPNPTWAKVRKHLVTAGRNDAAYMSDGTGAFGKNKPYFATDVHVVTFNSANGQTPKEANGTFAGCPAPVNCWVPAVEDGKEWFPVVEH